MPGAPIIARCRWCSRPLGELQRRVAEHCGAPACRHRTDQRMMLERREAALAQARAHAPAAAASERAPVIWLQHREPVMTALTDDERADHAGFLAAVAAEPQAHRRRGELAYPEDRGPGPQADAVVCGFCRGRCCEAGKGNRGFIDAELLERHAAEHGGSLHDAAAFYLARLPARHVADACLYQGEQGCVLPREARAPVCNGFACPPLKQARERLAGSGGAVLARFDADRVVAAAWAPHDRAPAQVFFVAPAAAHPV